MAKRWLSGMLFAAVLLASCGGDGDKTEPAASGRGKCTAPPAAVDVEGLPDAFPIVPGVMFTDSNEAGPSTIIEGYFEDDLEEVFPLYREAFENAHGWVILKDEQEADDAEIFFKHQDVNGQVNMFAECDGRTRLRITVRPS